MKLIIFDLDGTLLDTLADLADSANYTICLLYTSDAADDV